MRKLAILIGFCLLVLPLSSFSQAVDPAGQDVAVPPLVISAEGGGEVSFVETRWPDFYEFVPQGGCPGLADYSLKRKVEGTPDTFYPICGEFFCYVDEEATAYTPGDSDYNNIADLTKTVSFTGDWAEYRDTARVLVTWTVRLEGHKNIAQVNRKHDPWFNPIQCNGTSRQAFPEGNAYTRLFVNGIARGNPAIMTIPYGGTGSDSGLIDPTHTGAVVLSPEDFEGRFPEELEFQVKIYNDTCMELKSPAGMRNLIITITPIN